MRAVRKRRRHARTGHTQLGERSVSIAVNLGFRVAYRADRFLSVLVLRVISKRGITPTARGPWRPWGAVLKRSQLRKYTVGSFCSRCSSSSTHALCTHASLLFLSARSCPSLCTRGHACRESAFRRELPVKSGSPKPERLASRFGEKDFRNAGFSGERPFREFTN